MNGGPHVIQLKPLITAIGCLKKTGDHIFSSNRGALEMKNFVNHALKKLRGGNLAIGISIRQWRTTDIGRLLKPTDVDWVNIDMEHGSMTVDQTAALAIACQDSNITPLVRVPGLEHHHATRVLDNGAMGVIFPHVETPEDAARLVGYCKYPPVGHRSVVGRMVHFDYRAIPSNEIAEKANLETMVVIMLETPKGIDNANAIAAVPGVDVITIGPGDLSAEMGIPGQFDDPQFLDAIAANIAACKRHGVIAGCGNGPRPELVRTFIEEGVRYVQAGGDVNFMAAGAAGAVKSFRR